MNLLSVYTLSAGAAIGIGVFIVLLITIAVILSLSIRLVPQSSQYVVERFRNYKATWDSGFHMLVPFIDTVSLKVTLKEQVIDFAPQPVITSDNVTMQIDTVVFYQYTDAKLLAYGIAQPIKAIENLTATTLRNIIGELELDQTLTSRDLINGRMRATLDEATDPWGIKINRVEVKNILPPKDIREAMEKQMRAERERREAILKAEGQKKAAILRAEGEKEALIMSAEAEAQSILRVKSATAEGIKLINNAKVSDQYIKLQQIDAMIKIGESGSTKIVIPSDMQNLAANATVLKDLLAPETKDKK